ncbi:alpha-mannosidase 2-like [Mercenaria mercenaria]|uniref:alpha-mannosidase 2-like n=1 Tax=Mercenaria mercenaria TaxID=6596 RepID=UPI00234F377B|nr:alpha-mannosidase 2-like [Mercenaria mercenaria]
MRLRMKFRHRVVVMSVAGTLAVVYLFLMYTGLLPKIFSSHEDKLKKFMDKNPLSFSFKGWKVNAGQCRADFSVPKDVIATQDLAERTDFNTYVNGLYNLPHAELKDAAYGPNLRPLSVIIVPHSHLDPGWLETVDEYYNRKVKFILDHMVRKLHLYQDMTFIWAEIIFFHRWWESQSKLIKEQVHDLVKSGRLEIVSGGWVMPDEASTHYISVIDQLIEGHQWVFETFGIKPSSSWSIDPFGHSGTMPYLWKHSGMSNMVIGRIHQGTKGRLALEKSLEFYWKQYWSSSNSDDILCHVMPYMLYSLHHTCGPDKFICAMFDFRKIPGEPEFSIIQPITKENIVNKAKELYEQYRLKSSLFTHGTIFVPLGDDFRYDHIEEWDQQYENYKKLMKYMNSKPEWKINVKFGTINDYFKEIKNTEMSSLFPKRELSGDFFPYSDHDKAYWTGYFSTRPFDKRFSREVETRLRASEILHSIALAYSDYWNVKYKFLQRAPRLLKEARDNLGIFLHHDAITGTSKAYVVEDYEEKLLLAYDNAMHVMGSAAQFLLTKGKLDNDPSILEPELTRATYKQSSMHQKISPTKEGTRIVLYNPTSHLRSEFVEVIVDSVEFQIKDSKRKEVPFQINPVFVSGTEVDRTVFEIVFLTEISAFGIETYILQTINRTPKSFWSKITIYNSEELIIGPELKFEQERPRHRGNLNEAILIENSQIAAEFKPINGLLDKWIEKADNKTKVTKIMLDFKQYTSRGSGAYIFLPTGPATNMLQGTPVVRVIEGPFCTEVQSVYVHLYHRVRLYHHPGLQGRQLFIQNALNMFVLNMRDREPIMRILTSINNEKGSFFTDENGFQFIGRKRHPTDEQYQSIERSYYPVTTMAFIEDGKTRVTVHTGQAHGAASLERGWLEFMIDRQLLYDDERGLGEGISDNKLTMTKYMLTIEHYDTSTFEDKFTFPSMQANIINEFLNHPIQKMYTPINSEIVSPNFVPLKQPLPCDIFVVGMKSLYKADLSFNGTSLVIHRKGFRCGYPSDGLQCPSTNVNVAPLFPGVLKGSVRETSLTHLTTKQSKVNLENLQVPPMEIKSFVIS